MKRIGIPIAAVAAVVLWAGVAQATPTAVPTPSALAFGDANLGSPVVLQQLSIQNTGDTPLSFGSVQLMGADAASFQLGSNGCPASLDAGMSCALDVGFRPTASGLQQATLSIESDDPASPLNVPLAGTGTNPLASVSPADADFGELEVGTTSPQQTVTVTNAGTGSLILGGVWLQDDGNFQIVGGDCPGRTLQGNDSCAVELVFAPYRLGILTGTLIIDSNAGGSNVPLTGASSAAGTAVLSLSPNPIDFGSVNPGSTRQLQVHVANIGDGTLVFGNVEPILTGDIDQFDFLAATCGNLLMAGESCTATFVFHPTSNGAKSAGFGVPSNAANSPTTLELRGYGGARSVPSQNAPANPGTPVPPTPTTSSSPAAPAESRLSVRWHQASMVVVLKARRKGVTATYEVSGPADIRISLRNRSGKTIWSITTSPGRAGSYRIGISRQLLRSLPGRYRLVIDATRDDQHATSAMSLRITSKPVSR